jgi:hypothetical protein
MHDVRFVNAIYIKEVKWHSVVCSVFQVRKRMLRYLSWSSVKCFQGNGIHTTSYVLQAPKVAVVCIVFNSDLTSIVELFNLHCVMSEYRFTNAFYS